MGRKRTALHAATIVVAALMVLVLVAVLAVSHTSPQPVTASSGGKVGYSGNPAQGGQTCARCHRPGGGEANMRFWGQWSVEPGSTHMFTVTIGGTDQKAAGFNVSASDGSLRVPPGNVDIHQIGDELTHLNPKSVDFGTVHFNFLWTAPEEAGQYVLYGAGNSVNLDGGTSGDNVVTDTLEISVEDIAITATPPVAPTDATPTMHPPSPTATYDPTVVPTTPSSTSPTVTSTPSATPTKDAPEHPPIFLPLVLASWTIE